MLFVDTASTHPWLSEDPKVRWEIVIHKVAPILRIIVWGNTKVALTGTTRNTKYLYCPCHVFLARLYRIGYIKCGILYNLKTQLILCHNELKKDVKSVKWILSTTPTMFYSQTFVRAATWLFYQNNLGFSGVMPGAPGIAIKSEAPGCQSDSTKMSRSIRFEFWLFIMSPIAFISPESHRGRWTYTSSSPWLAWEQSFNQIATGSPTSHDSKVTLSTSRKTLNGYNEQTKSCACVVCAKI